MKLNHSDPLAQNRGTHRFLFCLWNLLALLFSSAGICVLSLLLGIGMFDVQIFLDCFRRPLIFLLNWLPILLMQLFFFSLFGRQWLAFLLNSLIFVSVSIGNFYKLRFRSEPFLYSDIGMVSAALEVSGNYDLTPNTRIILSIILVLGGTVFLFFFAKARPGWKFRFPCLLLIMISSALLWNTVYTNDTLYKSQKTAPVKAAVIWEQQRQVSKGFVYQFLYSIHDSGLTEPEGYDPEYARQILSEYSETDLPEDKKVNILVFQLEAFCDLETLGIEGIASEAYEAFHRLQDESLSGTLTMNVFAGGTVDTERCFLTGFYKLFEFRQVTPSVASWLSSQGYTTVGSHPNVQAFYNRVNVNRYLGFSDYWFLDNHYGALLPEDSSEWYSNPVLFSETAKQFVGLVEAGNHVFSFNVTLQGHGPYYLSCDRFTRDLWNGDSSDQASFYLHNYLNSVCETGELIWSLKEELQKLDDPVVLVLYGDHKPGLGDNDSVYHELGIKLNDGSEEGFFNQFSTFYLIWANDAAKRIAGYDFQGKGPTISAGFLMNLLFDRLGWTGDSFMQFTDIVMEHIPVISSKGYYMEDECFTRNLSAEGQQLLAEYDVLQYYCLTNR